MLCFQQVHAQQPPRLHGTTTEDQIFLLVADSKHVHPQQPVNTSVSAASGCSSLIPRTFTIGNARLLHSSHLGVTCHPTADAKQRGFDPGGTEARTTPTSASTGLLEPPASLTGAGCHTLPSEAHCTQPIRPRIVAIQHLRPCPSGRAHHQRQDDRFLSPRRPQLANSLGRPMV
jgi:hypothetical protein